MATVELKKGDVYSATINENNKIKIVIQQLTAKEVKFSVTGESVVNPYDPRIMPISSFIKWLRIVGARKVR